MIASGARRRVGARLHQVDHPAFESDAEIVVGGAAASLSYIMVPKVESVADVERAVSCIDRATRGTPRQSPMPMHVLIESPAAVHRAFDIAAHPRVESVSFGLMDFVSAHGGAIPSSAMTVRKDDTGDVGPVSPSAGGVGQAGHCQRLPCIWQSAFPLCGHRIP